MKSHWIGIDIKKKYNRKKNYIIIKNAIKQIIQDKHIETLFIGDALDEDMIDNAMDSYIFVKCTDTIKSAEKIKKLKYIKEIFMVNEKVHFFTNKEMDDLRKSWHKIQQENAIDFHYGDLVKIKTGVYQDLHGVLIKKINDKYEVLFKFCRGYVIKELSTTNFHIPERNLFDILKVPV